MGTLHINRTKSHVSAFLKRDGSVEFYVSVTFPFCGNLKYQVLVILSSLRNGNVKSCFRHIYFRTSAAVVRFCYISANGFLITLLNLCKENKLVMVLCSLLF